MKTIIVAPHPDDEVLGVGGTIFRRKSEGSDLAWIIVTAPDVSLGWSDEKKQKRINEIERITHLFGFNRVFEFGFPSAKLDQVQLSDIVAKVAEAFKEFEPEEVFVPHPSDIHTDHRVVFDAVASCTKWFRYPSIKRVLAYETLSESDFGLGISKPFQPNYFINIEGFLKSKLDAMEVYESEIAAFPFPRSREALRALALLRGAGSGYGAAEAFELLRQRE